MSEDPRYIEPRCEAGYYRGFDFGWQPARCEFRAGHKGLHYAHPDPSPGADAPYRWGSQAQVDQEIELREPDGIITIKGDLSADMAEALRRAFRRRDIP